MLGVGTSPALPICDMSAAIAIICMLAFVAGQWLVTKRSRFGFLIWGVSNLIVAAINFSSGDLAAGCLFLIYSLANGYSLFSWAKA